MEPLNIVGFDSKFGYRTVELLCGDLTRQDYPTDILVVSVYSGSYFPLEGTLLRSLLDVYSIDLAELQTAPAIDLRAPLGVWLSPPLDVGPAARILCVEIRGRTAPSEAFENVFASLALFGAKRISVSSVSMPLLGAGSQGLNSGDMASLLLSQAREYLESSPHTAQLRFVEKDGTRAAQIAKAMDSSLGRMRVLVPHDKLVEALRKDLVVRLQACEALFATAPGLRDDWIRLAQQEETRSVEFGVLARKLVETVVERFQIPGGNLADRIRKLEASAQLAPWACGYMQVLRHFGNNAAHASSGVHQITPSDLVAGMYCVLRILDVCTGQSFHTGEGAAVEGELA